MKGASVKVAILNFFTRQDPFIHHATFQLLLRLPSSFLWVFWNYWQILSSKNLIFSVCKIWVIAAPKEHSLGVWDWKWMRNKLLLLHFFSSFLNPQRDTLTYSALVKFNFLFCFVIFILWSYSCIIFIIHPLGLLYKQ